MEMIQAANLLALRQLSTVMDLTPTVHFDSLPASEKTEDISQPSKLASLTVILGLSIYTPYVFPPTYLKMISSKVKTNLTEERPWLTGCIKQK